MGSISTNYELSCVVTWFHQWTSEQRDLFLSSLLAKQFPHHPEAQLNVSVDGSISVVLYFLFYLFSCM